MRRLAPSRGETSTHRPLRRRSAHRILRTAPCTTTDTRRSAASTKPPAASTAASTPEDPMSSTDRAKKLLDNLPPRLASRIISGAQRIPRLRDVFEAEYEAMLDAAPVVRPDADVPVYSRLPEI